MKRTTCVLALLVTACMPEQQIVDEPEEQVGSQKPKGDVELVLQRPRARRRVDIDQLNASLKQVLGGISWTSDTYDPYDDEYEEGDMFEALAGALGVPDYARTTHEDLSTSILFAKFLEDAAVAVCNRRVNADYAGAIADRIIVADEDASHTKLRELVLLFHGNAAPSTDELTIWSGLFFAARARAMGAGATTAQAAGAGWKAICVGLIEHPDFTTY